MIDPQQKARNGNKKCPFCKETTFFTDQEVVRVAGVLWHVDCKIIDHEIRLNKLERRKK